MGCIYSITNKINGKKYIGQTNQPVNERFRQHIVRSKSNNCNSPLHIDMQKYDISNFILNVIEDNIPDDDLDKAEITYIEKYNTVKNGYNRRAGGKGGYALNYSQQNKVINMVKSGLSFKDVAFIFGVNKITIERICHNNNYYILNIDLDKLQELYYKDYKYEKIAEILNVDKATVMRNLHKLGLYRKRKCIKRRDNFNYDELKKDYYNQMSIDKICDKYNISKTSFYRIKNELQLHNRPQIYKHKTKCYH